MRDESRGRIRDDPYIRKLFAEAKSGSIGKGIRLRGEKAYRLQRTAADVGEFALGYGGRSFSDRKGQSQRQSPQRQLYGSQ
jgi:hypothetical protein